MNKDIYKKGLVLLALIVIALITVYGYIIGVSNDNGIMPEEENNTKEIAASDEEIQVESIIIIDINGAVQNPGIYELSNGKRVNDAINAAGGFTEDANHDYISKHINKARILQDQEKLYFPKIEDDVTSIEVTSIITSNENVAIGKININTATKDQLITLKGIGESFAQRIIDYRNEKKFNSIEDIKNVKGIGDKTFEQIKDNITVE